MAVSGYRNPLGHYLLTSLVLVCCLALHLRWPLQSFSFFLFIPAVLTGATLFGTGPAIFASLLAALIAVFFWLEPIYSFWLLPRQIPPLALYGLACIGIVGLSAWAREVFRYRQASLAAEASTVAEKPRFDGLDFWRGFALCTIFINHIPGNGFASFTSRNFGFSDAAEGFVFLSGVSLALAYGARFAAGSRLSVIAALAQRAFKLYSLHVALSLAGIAIFAAGAIYWKMPDLLLGQGRELFVEDAILCLEGIFSLGHQLWYFNILPLYIVLIAWVPLFLWLAEVDRRLMVALSAVLYAAARWWAWSLPNWPGTGGWYFDPFAWQFLMAIGLATGLGLAGREMPPVSRFCVALAAFVLAAGLLVTTNGFGGVFGQWSQLQDELDLDKTMLGLARLAHFLALAYILYVSGLTGQLRRLFFYKPIAALGRHSLLVFALLSLMAAAGQVLTAVLGSSLWLDVPMIGSGILALCGAARLAEAAKTADRAMRRTGLAASTSA